MRVLLIGEFSSLHKSLKEGLVKNGNIQVTLIASGDGWKKIKGNDKELPENNKYKNKIAFYRALYDCIKEQRDYDVVQLMHINQFPVLLNTRLVKLLKKHNGKLAVLSAGGDYAVLKAYREGLFEHYIYDDVAPLHYEKSAKGYMEILSALNVQKQADIIIPTAYEYMLGYRGLEKVASLIPFPVNLDKLIYRENTVTGKVRFFHGISREGVKGSCYIKEALLRLQDRYPNDVEILIDGRMPYDKYLTVLEKSNVLIDQCLGYGYGINGCLGMALGKVVMSSGFRDENIKAYGMNSAPGIYIKPDVQYIYKKLCTVLERKDEFPEWGMQGRNYVEQVHDYEKVAKKYLEVWNGK